MRRGLLLEGVPRWKVSLVGRCHSLAGVSLENSIKPERFHDYESRFGFSECFDNPASMLSRCFFSLNLENSTKQIRCLPKAMPVLWTILSRLNLEIKHRKSKEPNKKCIN